MTDPEPDADENACWQCGKPANPGCAVTMDFTARADAHLDTCGYRVTRRGRMEHLKVRIPRCKDCESRDTGCGCSLFVCLASGSFLAAWLLSSAVMIVVAWCVLGYLSMVTRRWYERSMGRRLPTDYPPLRRLREAGWKPEHHGSPSP